MTLQTAMLTKAAVYHHLCRLHRHRHQRHRRRRLLPRLLPLRHQRRHLHLDPHKNRQLKHRLAGQPRRLADRRRLF